MPDTRYESHCKFSKSGQRNIKIHQTVKFENKKFTQNKK